VRALTRSSRGARETSSETLSGMLTRSYWDALSGLVAVTVSQLPGTTPMYRSTDDD
jgi:hypothetical protein